MRVKAWALAVFIAAVEVPAAEVVDRIVAVVGKDIITLRELESAQEKDALGLAAANPLSPVSIKSEELTREEYLDKMIEIKLVEQEVNRQGISVSAMEVEKAIERQKKKMGISDEQFIKLLEREGISMEQYRNKVKQDLVTIRLIGREVRAAVEIKDEEILTYYRQHKEDFVGEDEVNISILSVAKPAEPTGAKAGGVEKIVENARKRIIEGGDFADLAIEISKTGVPAQGGDMGWFKKRELKPGFREVVNRLQPGEVSEPFELDDAWHLLRVKEWKKGQEAPYDEVKDSIRDSLYQEEVQEKYSQWLERLKARSHVEIRL